MKLSISILLIIFITVPSFAVSKLEKATFAGGCFWCMEPPFEKLPGVKSVISGFSGGTKKNPLYKEVASGQTKHLEVVQISYDPEVVSYKKLLEVFWKNIDPTDKGGQFVDRGHQYSSAIFFHSEQQRKLAKVSIKNINSAQIFTKPIVTTIRPYNSFYPAEDYHQDFYKRSITTKLKYKYYRARSGRDQFLDKFWKTSAINFFNKQKYFKPTPEEIKQKLTKLQYEVTQEDGTERPFKNEFWNNKKEGIYVDIVSGEPLFSSKDKFKSGTGWPSFTKPLVKNNIIEKEDNSLFSKRIEVRSRFGDSHLGHVFNDGPKPTGLRYCINSASLKFIPKEELKNAGYDELQGFFE